MKSLFVLSFKFEVNIVAAISKLVTIRLHKRISPHPASMFYRRLQIQLWCDGNKYYMVQTLIPSLLYCKILECTSNEIPVINLGCHLNFFRCLVFILIISHIKNLNSHINPMKVNKY